MNFLIILKLFLLFNVGTGNERVLPLLMPNISTDRIQEDSYLCTAYKTNPNEAEYVTEFKPNAPSPQSLHHILIFGCETLTNSESQSGQGDVWDCKFIPQKSCGPGLYRILYTWSRNAPTFEIPEGIGFKVGGNTKLNYLVMSVHYIKLDRNESKLCSPMFN